MGGKSVSSFLYSVKGEREVKLFYFFIDKDRLDYEDVFILVSSIGFLWVDRFIRFRYVNNLL